MKKTELAIILGLIISVIFSSFTSFSIDCNNVRGEVLRLHILANSDSEEDQALKLKIRDEILKASPEIFDSTDDLEGAINCAEQNLSKIEEIAKAEIEKSGFDYSVRAEIDDMYFETREYDGVTMPAGEYKAVRVKIGKAEGKNWWCVLFPALCIPAAQGQKELSDVLTDSEIDTISTPKFKAKFAIVEFFQNLKN